MKLERTVDGLFAAPVTVPTTASGNRMRSDLEADVLAKAPELAEFLNFRPKASAAAPQPCTTFGQLQQVVSHIEFDPMNIGSMAGTAK
jgi:hypothetical protein